MKSIDTRIWDHGLTERRSHRRCKPEIGAFVSFKNNGAPLMCKLLNISLGGLAFGCTPFGSLLSDLNKLSIVIPNPVFYLENLSFELISDTEIDTGSTKGFACRSWGVKFTDLNPKQAASLNCLIETLLALPWGFSFADQNLNSLREKAVSWGPALGG